MLLNIEKLRQDLMDYYGTAAHSGFPAAMMDVIDVETALPEKLVELANRAGMNLRDYAEEEMER